jgi:carbamoyl-phosphate synthase large subunit
MANRHDIRIIIPNMDAATVPLSRLRKTLKSMDCWAVVSDADLCTAMEDKLLAEQWFLQHGISVPTGRTFPCVVKHRLGFGARDQYVACNGAELEVFFARRTMSDYIIQPLVTGQEYTVDAYVDLNGSLIAALSRKRLEVSSGEVDMSETHRQPDILSVSRQILAIPGWQGPITLQFFETERGPMLIEINPRFGGGATHSIHSGLDMPRWILREAMGRAIAPFDDWPENSLMVRCRRDIFI